MKNSKKYKPVSVAQVAERINFDLSQPDWLPQPGGNSMADRQAEGVAGLLNRLHAGGLALLADEVGMGKTLQALAVMAWNWQKNPAAKVLVMAPNRDICQHWETEFATFFAKHVRDKTLCPALTVAYRLEDLVTAVQAGSSQLCITTIHALSHLLSSAEKETTDDRAQAALTAASRIHQRLKAALGAQGFDLLVIDEAHYFRHAWSGSQRASAARGLFGPPAQPLSQQVLLMTATPSYSSLDDIPNMFSYFLAAEGSNSLPDADELLRRFAIRRMRILSGAGGKAFNKYHYREERALPASLAGDERAELFFALYHKLLLKENEQADAPRRFFYGYLEGFESTTPQRPTEQADNDNQGQSWHQAPDSSLLQQLTEAHQKFTGSVPEHPKYQQLVDLCRASDPLTPCKNIEEHKHLVFVRRIPSVRELTRRINDDYDRQQARLLLEAWLPEDQVAENLAQWHQDKWSRSWFNGMVRWQSAVSQNASRTGKKRARTRSETAAVTDPVYQDEYDADADHDLPHREDDATGSRIADLFTVKKGGNPEENRSDCANVRQRFRKKESLFALFLEPAADYCQAEYPGGDHAAEQDRDRINYVLAAQHYRLLGQQAVQRRLPISQPATTAWALVWPLLIASEQQQILDWRKTNPRIVENFSRYLQSGFLYASPVMIELYCWYTGFWRQRQQRGEAEGVEGEYRAFIRFVQPKIAGSHLFNYFSAALRTFEALCTKVVSRSLEDCDTPWTFISSMHSPARFASGETGNRTPLKIGFNSPFYPNVLVATAVFQEGVNLHLQCRKVHHYGLAWTPGANEQRIGRVDRLFGLLNHQLRQRGETRLTINYPYLENSFDQEQLARFIIAKHQVEKRVDACRVQAFSGEIDMQVDGSRWRDYLRQPDPDASAIDPWPALREDEG